MFHNFFDRKGLGISNNQSTLSSSSKSMADKRTVGGVSEKQDIVFVRDLFVKALTGVDAWHRPQPQPVSISIWLPTNVSRAGETDHLVYSLNYDVISRKVTHLVESGKFRTLEDIAERVANEVLKDSLPGQIGRFQVRKPRALLRAGSVDIDITRRKTDNGGIGRLENTTDTILIHKLELVTVIGVNTIERLHRQNIIIDLTLHKPTNGDNKHRDAGEFNEKYDFREVVEAVSNHVESSSYKTVEAFVVSVAQVACQFGIEKVTVRAEKPSAITFADAAGVEVTRTKEYFERNKDVVINGVETNRNYIHSPLPETKTPSPNSEPQQSLFPESGVENQPDGGVHRVYLAFGSNTGDTVNNVETALDELKKKPGIVKIVQTSSLYESEPMYVQDQDKFLNGVVEIETTLAPLDLLDTVKEVEYKDLQRVKEVENGPRSIDLDILLYDNLVMNNDRLNIPHINMLSRSFVLQPLIDIMPSSAVHPLTAEPYQNHLDQIPKEGSQIQKSSGLQSVVPLKRGSGRKLQLEPIHNTHPTQIMGILNITPDSFSDGGQFISSSDGVNKVVKTARKLALEDGANILDIGGASTRPNSEQPAEQEELNRVIPAIKALRDCSELDHIPISVDTYRAAVARAAIQAGADIINDISAGKMSDNEIFEVAREENVPIVLNHIRGTPETMAKYADYHAEHKNFPDNSDEAVIEVVKCELEERVNEAISAGLRRWQIILDPGIGFAKSRNHNLAIIRRFDELKARAAFAGIPWLLGTSRKGFIGKITGQNVASDRVLGTAATVTALIGKGADIVRVHDVNEINQAVKVSDAIYRDI